MKLICFYDADWEKEYFAEKLSDFEIQFFKGTTTDHPSLSDHTAEILCVFVDSPVNEAFLKRFPALKLIATRSTGIDHIEKNAAQKRAITVCMVPTYGRNAVAEYTIGLMIMVMRNMYTAHHRVRKYDFSRTGLCGTDLHGKTLGVIGTGAIGSHVVAIATAFGMHVYAYDVTPNEELVKKTGCTYTTLETLLKTSDIISLHVPYTPDTHHLINKTNISTLKRGAFLINTARGPVIETTALIEGLRTEILAGIGLDVLEQEGALGHEDILLMKKPLHAEELHTTLANHYLINHPRVIITAHNAFNSYEARRAILDCTIDNIAAFVHGAPKNIVY
jgi:D-lactate dehydrogenase